MSIALHSTSKLSTVLSQFFKNPHVGTYRACLSFFFFFFLKKLFKHALICEDPSDKREQRLWKGVCGGTTFQNFLLHHLSHHAELFSSWCWQRSISTGVPCSHLRYGEQCPPRTGREEEGSRWPWSFWPVPSSPLWFHVGLLSTISPSPPLPSFLSSRLLPSFCFLVPDLATMLGQERMVSVCFHRLPQLNLGFFFCFLYESRCERGWLEGNTKFQIHKGRECWWAQGWSSLGMERLLFILSAPLSRRLRGEAVKLHLASQRAERAGRSCGQKSAGWY